MNRVVRKSPREISRPGRTVRAPGRQTQKLRSRLLNVSHHNKGNLHNDSLRLSEKRLNDNLNVRMRLAKLNSDATHNGARVRPGRHSRNVKPLNAVPHKKGFVPSKIMTDAGISSVRNRQGVRRHKDKLLRTVTAVGAMTTDEPLSKEMMPGTGNINNIPVNSSKPKGISVLDVIISGCPIGNRCRGNASVNLSSSVAGRIASISSDIGKGSVAIS